jgi:hypothetical protein
MDEPTRPDPRLDGPVEQIDAQDGPVPCGGRVHVLDAHAEICRIREVSFGAALMPPRDDG